MGDALDLGSLIVRLNADTGTFMRNITAARSGVVNLATSIGELGSTLARTGRRMMMFATLPIVTNMALATNQFAKFEQAMRNVNTIAQETQHQFKASSAEVLAMSVELGKDPGDLAKALYNINSASRLGAEGLQLLNVATRMGVAGMSSTEDAALALTGVLNAYSMSTSEAGDVADILFKTVEKGVITFPELAGALSNVVATAATAKVPFEEIAAAVATMTRGSHNASKSTMSLNRLMMRLVQGGEELDALYQRMTGTTASATLQTQGLGAAMKVIVDASEEDIDSLTELGFRIRDLKAAASLTRDEGRAFAKDLEWAGDRAKRAGAMMHAFQEATKALQFQLNRAKTAVKLLYIAFGEALAPAVRKVVDGFMSFAGWLTNLDTTSKQTIIRMAAMFAAIGPILMVLGTALMGIAAILKLGVLAGAGALLASLMATLPVVFALAGAVAVVGAVLTRAFAEGESGLDKMDRGIKSTQQSMLDFTNNSFEWMMEWGSAIPAIFEQIKLRFFRAFDSMMIFGQTVFENIVEGFMLLPETVVTWGAFFMAYWENLWMNAGIVVTTALENLFTGKGLMEGIEDELLNLPKVADIEWTQGNWKDPVEAALDTYDSYADRIAAAMIPEDALYDKLNDFLNGSTPPPDKGGGTGGGDTSLRRFTGGGGALEAGSVEAYQAVLRGKDSAKTLISLTQKQVKQTDAQIREAKETNKLLDEWDKETAVEIL